jgi:uncharacterized protein (TIGR02284 family)
MDKEIATLQKLLDALNDSSILYRRLASGTASSHLKLLLGRAIRVHRWIAGELGERMRAAGGTPRHAGSLLGPLHALHTHWLARISPDVELAYVARAARREDDVLRCFDDAVGTVRNIELRDHLQAHLHKIEHACTQIEHLGPPLPAQAYAMPTPQSIRATAQSGSRTTVQTRDRARM